MKKLRISLATVLTFALCLLIADANAEDVAEFQIQIREHLFYPAEFDVPAGRRVKLMIVNLDATPEEFESYELNREKVIVGGAKAIVYIGPLPAGEYTFFGEFNPKTAQGKITAIGKP